MNSAVRKPARAKAGVPKEADDEVLAKRILRKAAIAFLIAAITVAMLTQGAVYPLAADVACLLMAASLTLAYFVMGVPKATRGLFVTTLACWILVAAWTALQSVPAPLGMGAHPAWAVLSEFGIPAKGSISPMPGVAPSAIVGLSLPAMALLTVLMLFRRDSTVERALWVFSIAGGALAVFALFQYIAFPKSLMLGEKVYYIGNLTAPFVNRNTAATFYGVTLIALLSNFKGFRFQMVPGSHFFYQRSGWSPAEAMQWLFLVAAAFGAVLATSSRGGVLATFIALFVLFGMAAIYSRSPSSSAEFALEEQGARRRNLLRLVGVFLLLLLVASLFAGQVVLRAEIQGSDDGRLCVLPGILAAVRDRLPYGIGTGAFVNVFPAYRDSACGTLGVWEMAHNVYLDALLALGLPFVVILFTSVGVLYALLRRGLLHRKSRRMVVLGGIASCVLVAVHSATDFSLQIPGFAIWWFTYLGLVGSISAGRLSSRAMKN